mgnify:FL=1
MVKASQMAVRWIRNSAFDSLLWSSFSMNRGRGYGGLSQTRHEPVPVNIFLGRHGLMDLCLSCCSTNRKRFSSLAFYASRMTLAQ